MARIIGTAGSSSPPVRRKPPARPVRKVAPPAGVFGPLQPADAPIRRAQQVARVRTNRAQRAAEKNVVLPAIPKLSSTTAAQRGTASSLVAASAHRQGIRTGQEVANLPTLQRQRVNRTLGYDNTAQTRGAVALALSHGLTGTQAELARAGTLIAAQHAVRAHAGVPHRRLEALGLNLDLSNVASHITGAVGHAFSSGDAGNLGHFLSHDVPGFAGRIGSDAVHIPQNAVLGIYGIGHAGVRAAQGDTTEASRLLHGLTHGAAGDLFRGDFKGSVKQFSQHPLYAALDFSGVEGIAGRGLGTAARVGGHAGEALGAEGNALARAGSTARAPLKLGDTGQIVERRYSPDLIRKAGQVLADRRRARGGADPNVATGSRLTRELHRAADETAAQAEGARRPGRAAAQKTSRTLERGTPRGLRDLVQGAAESELRAPATLEHDLRSKYQRLQAAWDGERATMTADVKRNNRSQRQLISTILADPKKLERARQTIFPIADQYRAHADQVEADLVRTGALDAEQAKAAKLRTYAVAHMGARFDRAKRAPEELAQRHDQAGAVEQRAKDNLASVRSQLEAASARRSRIVGRNASQRGVDRARGGEPGTMLRREADRSGAIDAATQNVNALRAAKRQAEAAFRKARRDRVASNPKRYTTGLVDAAGSRITTRQIEEHIAADPHAKMPAFVSHRPGAGGTSAHFVNWLGSRKGADGAKVRTGDAARVGGQDPSFRALEDSLVRGQGVADAAKNFDRYVGDLGVKHPSGRPFTWEEATKYADHLVHDANGEPRPNAVKMVPLRVVPARYDRARAERIVGGQATPAHQDVGGLTQQRLEESLRPPSGAERAKANVVLLPEVQVKRLMEHQFGKTTDTGKAFQAATGAFRSTVLPFSAKWLTGNSVEAALRLALNDTPAGLVASAHAGVRVLRALAKHDQEAAKAFDVRATGGLLYGGQRTVYGGAERFVGTKFEKPAQAAAALRQLPVVKQAVDTVAKYQQTVFALNAKLEHSAQVVAVGKEARREMQAMTGSWVKATVAQKAAVADVARGLVNTPAQVRYARAVDETLGKYSRFSPDLRRTIQTAAPFLPWYLNSARFVLHTLPVRHPVKLAVLASVERTLNADFVAQHKDVPPGSLQSAIPTKDGGWLDLSRYTPFGATTGGASSLADPILPQLSSVLEILKGNAWTGSKLRLADGSTPGEGKKVALALYAALESVLPGVGVARRLQEHGQTAFDDSTVFAPKTKQGTSHGSSPLDRVFNPLRPTYLKKKGPSGPLAGMSRQEYQGLLREAKLSGAAVQPSPDEMRKLLREAQLAAGG